MAWVVTDNVKYFNMIATYGQKEHVKFCVNGQKSDQLSQNPDKVAILKLKPMRTTFQLVKNNILSFIELIRKGVGKLQVCVCAVQYYASFIMIGLTNVCILILTNQT